MFVWKKSLTFSDTTNTKYWIFFFNFLNFILILENILGAKKVSKKQRLEILST